MSDQLALAEPGGLGQSGAVRGGLVIRDLHKSYGPAHVLKGIDLNAPAGEIHALLGENGAGKSTLMKVLSGVVHADRGSISLSGAELTLGTPRAATKAGVRTVFQELSSIGHLTVAENLLYGSEPMVLGQVSRRKMEKQAAEILVRMELAHLSPRARVSTLSLGDRQLLEVAKALREPAQVLVLDEATSALSAQDSAWVLARARDAADAGAVVILITHRLAEVRENADRFTVLRSGVGVLAGVPGDHSDDELITAMLGRRVEALYSGRHAPAPEVRLEVDGLRVGPRIGPITLDVRGGEILGLGGLQGQGQREVLQALAGAIPRTGGSVMVDGAPFAPRTPSAAIHAGVTYVPEDRQTEGLFLQHTVSTNMTISSLRQIASRGMIDASAEDEAARAGADGVGVAQHRLRHSVSELSGGNQQKVVLAKALMSLPRVLLLHDCTRGVDVGTKAEIFRLMARLAAEGTTIVFYSSDLSELAHVCHRVLVMAEGRQRGIIQGSDLSESAILRLSVGSAHDHREPQ